MKSILIILIAILLYWVIGFLIIALMATLGFFDDDDDNEEDFFFALYSLCWPFFALLFLVYLLWLLVKFIGIKISILPVAIVAYIKGEVEKKEENK